MEEDKFYQWFIIDIDKDNNEYLLIQYNSIRFECDRNCIIGGELVSYESVWLSHSSISSMISWAISEGRFGGYISEEEYRERLFLLKL